MRRCARISHKGAPQLLAGRLDRLYRNRMAPAVAEIVFIDEAVAFRYHAASRVIVFAWVNDEHTKRAYESSDDAYRVFQRMLETGHPPDDWNQLLAEAQASAEGLQRLVGRDVT